MNKITSAISADKNLFEKVASQHSVSTNKRFQRYTILNYKKMLDEMCEFIDGYVSYKGKDGETYKGKVLSTTVHFYERMFTDQKEYRIDFDLTQMSTITEDFLKGSKRLQQLVDEYSAEQYKSDKELKSLIALTENQFMKVNKVHSDDMKIYLYLTSKDSKIAKYTPPSSVMSAFKNKSTPVIHEKKA